MADYVVGGVVALLLLFAIRNIVKTSKNGGCSGCSSCSSEAASCCCSSKECHPNK